MHTTSTDCASLDRLLDGGLESDAITLVFGEGGSGKTNLALQCARVVASAGKRVAYIDTEGVSQKRLEQVFETLPDHERDAAEDRLLFHTPYTIGEQERMVKATALLRDVGLIVVDSINMHYRLHIDAPESEKEAGRSLYQQLHHLTMHARQHHIPVLITGQVYGGEDATQPFARRVMEHLVKALVRFEKRPDGTRRATVLKHRSIEEGRQTRFRIGPHGLEDLDGATRATGTSSASHGGPASRAPAPGGPGDPAAPDASDSPAASTHGSRPAPDPAPAPGTGIDPGTGPVPAGSRPGSLPDAPPAPEGSSEHRPRRAPTGPADLDAPERDEVRRDADAWGVGEGGPATDGTSGETAGFVPQRPSPQGADTPDAEDRTDAPVPPPSDADEGPATSLLTEEERREAEALPGFSRASTVRPPERPEEGAEGR